MIGILRMRNIEIVETICGSSLFHVGSWNFK